MPLDDENLSSLIRNHATRHAAPDELRARIRTHMALADAARGQPDTAAPPQRRRWFDFAWGTAAAGFVLGGLCVALLLPPLARLGSAEPLDAQLVSRHVLALRDGTLVAVASSDRHTVKPWFQGRLDYAPPVLDLAGDGFPLLGGRVEQLGGHAVAALVFAHNLHRIDLFVQPSAEQQAPALALQRGFSLVHWADGSMRYAAVSDMDDRELEAFAQAWRRNLPRP